MDLRTEILNQIKWILKNQQKYLFWVPISAFALGTLAAIINYYINNTPKYVVNEPCSVCYTQNRSVIVEPCNHLVLCQQCSTQVSKCPFCRKPIRKRTLIAQYIAN